MKRSLDLSPAAAKRFIENLAYFVQNIITKIQNRCKRGRSLHIRYNFVLELQRHVLKWIVELILFRVGEDWK